MSPLWQGIVAGALVALALLFAGWRLAPVAWRLGLLNLLERRLPPRGTGRPSGLHRWIDQRRQGLAGGCAGCAPGRDLPPRGR